MIMMMASLFIMMTDLMKNCLSKMEEAGRAFTAVAISGGAIEIYLAAVMAIMVVSFHYLHPIQRAGHKAYFISMFITAMAMSWYVLHKHGIEVPGFRNGESKWWFLGWLVIQHYVGRSRLHLFNYSGLGEIYRPYFTTDFQFFQIVQIIFLMVYIAVSYFWVASYKTWVKVQQLASSLKPILRMVMKLFILLLDYCCLVRPLISYALIGLTYLATLPVTERSFLHSWLSRAAISVIPKAPGPVAVLLTCWLAAMPSALRRELYRHTFEESSDNLFVLFFQISYCFFSILLLASYQALLTRPNQKRRRYMISCIALAAYILYLDDSRLLRMPTQKDSWQSISFKSVSWQFLSWVFIYAQKVLHDPLLWLLKFGSSKQPVDVIPCVNTLFFLVVVSFTKLPGWLCWITFIPSIFLWQELIRLLPLSPEQALQHYILIPLYLVVKSQYNPTRHR